MNSFFYSYIVMWSGACIISLILFLKDKESYAFYHVNYWRFLLIPWKLITFVIAIASFTAIAPYTFDPTWDYLDAIFMSLLTFLTAPWVVGIMYKTFKKVLPIRQTFVAFCIWMFSVGWSYDLYWLIRSGHYPTKWLLNIFFSSALYILAGLMWNLDYKEGKGVIFSFIDNTWPASSSKQIFIKISFFVFLFIFAVIAIIAVFLWL